MTWARIFALALALGATLTTSALAIGNDYTVKLRPSVTVSSPAVTLGDLFEGDLMWPEKAVAPAPKPGQRFVLGSKWLANVARTYGIDWRPANTYDRAMVYRPGQTISEGDILDRVEQDLIAMGMPNNYGLSLSAPLGHITIAADAVPDIAVREPFFDAGTGAFSAVVEVPAGTPNAQFIPVRGNAFPTVSVPALNRNVSKNTLITDSMIEWIDVPTAAVRRDVVMDAYLLVGKSPRTFIRAGEQVRDNDIIQVTLVDIPVPRHDLREGTEISTSHIDWITMNQSDVSQNIVTDIERLIGLSPRRFLPAGAPIRVSDVHIVVPVDVPVALRDVRRGEILTEEDFHWITMNENELAGGVLTDERDVIGQTARRAIRAGQVFRGRDLRTPVLIERGKIVTIRLETPFMQLSAMGKALENGGAGETMRIMNTLSNKTIFATVIDADTVRVDSLQTASVR